MSLLRDVDLWGAFPNTRDCQPYIYRSVNARAMEIRYITVIAYLIALMGEMSAQSHVRVDTIPSVTGAGHLYLSLEVPLGEMHIKSSGVCGLNVGRFASHDSMLAPFYETQLDTFGNLVCHMSLVKNQLIPRDPTARTAVSNSHRFREQLYDMESYTSTEIPQTEFLPDPELSTDLYLNLGMGAARLDFSDLNLHNASVNSAFSDIVILYDRPNKQRMEQLEVRTAKGDVMVKNVELARADLVTIQNNWGDTQVVLGDRGNGKSTIYLKTGMGSTTLIVKKDQPVQIVLRAGIFTSLNISDRFKRSPNSRGILVNAAFEADPANATKVICQNDFGDITIIETD
ncbi:hypothetical protein [Pontibacter sp. G13]|uniref:hypothetical protein n=1 Tax=Pontibacter sp. G13 TaxID=3074898 RepID=UPI00288B8CDA|nr:hypothetical protein [Pontibacter sp. G13]WNJ16322.1 hypothetical protein RJD25_15770 [Pontibacter sp. G13]